MCAMIPMFRTRSSPTAVCSFVLNSSFRAYQR
jgi:hypothetical protein